MFIRLLWESPLAFVVILFLVTFSVCCHEFMHAFVALKMGDDTAACRGHLTLNPLKQMGLISLLMMIFIGIAWGQVPINRANFRSRAGLVATILAGPLTNLALWVIFILIHLTAGKLGSRGQIMFMLEYGAMLNLVLFVFNMLPVPGLDGFNIISEFFPGLFRRDSEIVKGAYFLLAALLFSCSKWIFGLAFALTDGILRALYGVAA